MDGGHHDYPIFIEIPAPLCPAADEGFLVLGSGYAAILHALTPGGSAEQRWSVATGAGEGEGEGEVNPLNLLRFSLFPKIGFLVSEKTRLGLL